MVVRLVSCASALSPEETLRAELAEAIEARQRALADFQNFQRRSLENEKRAIASGRMDVIRPLLGVLDQVDLALSQDSKVVSVEAIFSGVQLVRDEMCRVLDGQGVVAIDPEPGADFDAHHHQAVVHAAKKLPQQHRAFEAVANWPMATWQMGQVAKLVYI